MSLNKYSTKKEKIKTFEDKLLKRHGGDFILTGEYINSSTRTSFIHVPCGREITTTPTILLQAKPHFGCKLCQYDAKRDTVSSITKKIFDVSGGEYIFKPGQEYVNNREEIILIHSVCGNSFTTYWETFSHNVSCPICRKNVSKLISVDEFRARLAQVTGEYILADDAEYLGATIGIHTVHTSCGYDWYPQPRHLLNGHGCPKCNDSLGEKLVGKILVKLHIPYREQEKFSKCVYKKELPFDFSLLDLSGNIIGLIEYDGSQHYIAFKHFGGDEGLRIRKLRDKIKDDYCELNSIPLLRIPYTLKEEQILNTINEFISNIK